MITAKIRSIPSIVPIWQPVGYSTYQITNLLAQKYMQKATHTGVLDPLAEGVIIVLLGDERYQKLDHTSWLKEYEFEITFGVSTDSYDGMGLVTTSSFEKALKVEDLEQVFKSLVGPYLQKVPLYSAQKVAGKKLFMYPKLGIPTPELPIKTGKIHELKLLSFEKTPLHDKIKQSIENVAKILNGEFRQEDIVESWKKFIDETPNHRVETAKIKVTMTRGLYVRSLCQDIAKKLEKPGYVSKLTRTKNGKFTKENSQTLEKLFGDNFDPSLFTSRYATLVKL